MDWNLFYAACAVMGTTLGSVWGHSLWLNKQFSSIRNTVYEQADKLEKNITDKLEYHERHDDDRFSQMHDRFGQLKNDIWEIKLTNAARFGLDRPVKVQLQKEEQDTQS